jgi:acetylornithine deacetylase/succinyl-diaminopimelate desuccinylase-like protein
MGSVPIFHLFVDPADNRIHGLDERVEIRRTYEMREFLYRLVKRLAD